MQPRDTADLLAIGNRSHELAAQFQDLLNRVDAFYIRGTWLQETKSFHHFAKEHWNLTLPQGVYPYVEGVDYYAK